MWSFYRICLCLSLVPKMSNYDNFIIFTARFNKSYFCPLFQVPRVNLYIYICIYSSNLYIIYIYIYIQIQGPWEWADALHVTGKIFSSSYNMALIISALRITTIEIQIQFWRLLRSRSSSDDYWDPDPVLTIIEVWIQFWRLYRFWSSSGDCWGLDPVLTIKEVQIQFWRL